MLMEKKNSKLNFPENRNNNVSSHNTDEKSSVVNDIVKKKILKMACDVQREKNKNL